MTKRATPQALETLNHPDVKVWVGSSGEAPSRVFFSAADVLADPACLYIDTFGADGLAIGVVKWVDGQYSTQF